MGCSAVSGSGLGGAVRIFIFIFIFFWLFGVAVGFCCWMMGIEER